LVEIALLEVILPLRSTGPNVFEDRALPDEILFLAYLSTWLSALLLSIVLEENALPELTEPLFSYKSPHSWI